MLGVVVTFNDSSDLFSFSGSNVLESRIATMLPNLAKGSSGMNSMAPPSIVSQADIFTTEKPVSQVPDVYTPPPRLDQPPAQPIQSVQPVPPPEPAGDDAGSSTPVQDEQEEKEPSPPPKSVSAPKPSETKTKTNPIDFLSQLLTKTSSSSSSSNFLQTLSLLTNTVKTQYQKKQNEEAEGQVQEEESKPPSPTFSAGMNEKAKSASPEFTGVPPPVPNSQTGSWSSWKQVNAAQPDPSSPPVISQPKTPDLTHHPPPLPQHPPPPSDSGPSRPYNMQPPSPQDFSLPPPSIRQSVSQSFINPPPPLPPRPSNSQQFSTSVSSASFQQVTNSQAGQPVVLSASVAPTNLVSPQSGMGFTPFGIAPPVSNSGPAQLRPQAPPLPAQPLNPTSGFPQVPSQQPVPAAGFPQAPNQQPVPVSGFPMPPAQPRAPVSGFIQGQDNAWEPPRPVASEPVQPSMQNPYIRGPFAPPPPPPNSAAPPQWQPESARADSRPDQNFNNQISSVPSQRSNWNNAGNRGYDDNWESGIVDTENQSGGYAHPWDQPQNYDEEEDENEFVDEILETSLPPAPKKSILRNSRTSSLREVTLVEETTSKTNVVENVLSPETNKHYTPGFPQPREHKPVSILKKSNDVKPVTSQGDSAQSEFINILKQKSGANSNLPDVPPSSRTLTTIPTGEPAPSGHSLENNRKGEPISTIGVVGNSGRSSSVKSDDMDLDLEEQEYTNSGNSEGQWHPDEDWAGSRQNSEMQGDGQGNFNSRQDFERHEDSEMHGDFDNHKNFERRHEFERHQNFERRTDFERRDFNGPPPQQFDRHDFNGPPSRSRWSEQRPWQQRPSGQPDYGGFPQRGGFQPRPRFQDNFRGPSPAKRPYFPPRHRMPFNRY